MCDQRMPQGLCECGHSWWKHHWDIHHGCADRCMDCQCKTYSKMGTSCYWLVRLYYNLEHPHTHKAIPNMRSWIGDEIRYEQDIFIEGD